MYIEFSGKSEARGRNGWFTLMCGDLDVTHRDDCSAATPWRAWLMLYSKQVGRNAPVQFWFANAVDLRRLGQALLDAAAHLEAQDQEE